MEAADGGAHVFMGRESFDEADALPLMILFAPSHMAFEIDRDPALQPSLAEMTTKALELLSTGENGFFLVVEGARIDHAAHVNDAAAHLRDVLAYDDAVAAALGFAERDGRTLVVSTADHETGGLSLGRNIDGKPSYDLHLDVLGRSQASTGVLATRIEQGLDPATVLARGAGIAQPSDRDVDALTQVGRGPALRPTLQEIINRRAGIGWTTLGHTAVDVLVYAYGPGAERLAGHQDNTDLAETLADLMGFDLAALTRSLRGE